MIRDRMYTIEMLPTMYHRSTRWSMTALKNIYVEQSECALDLNHPELFGRQIQVGAEEILSKTPEFYRCNLIAGVMQKECDQLFVEAKRLRDLQLT